MTTTFHAYTDGTDTIIGTSVDEAIAAYRDEYQIGEYPDGADEFEELSGDKHIKIRDYDGKGNTKTMTVREWIDYQVAHSPFSRLLCSTEY